MNRSDFYANAEKFLNFLSPESILELQKKETVYRALIESQVLQDLQKYRPVVAGTFPLGIATDRSDLDILLTSSDLPALREELQNLYGNRDGFQVSEALVSGEPSLIVNFNFQNVPFEIFAQKIESSEQTAFKHFQVEERLLKLGGEAFKEKIKRLRAGNLKTEPAFAMALGLSGDPYLELLKLHLCSEAELRFKFSF